MKKLILCVLFLCFCVCMVSAFCRPYDVMAVEAPDVAEVSPTPTPQESIYYVRALISDDPEEPRLPEEEKGATQGWDTIPALATGREIDLLARTIWGEAEGVKSRDEQAAVAWCVLNRVDAEEKSIEDIVLAPHQFYCRTWDATVPEYFLELAQDVVYRWEREHAGFTNVGRTLPAEYLFFLGDGSRNHFTVEWQGTEVWDWSLSSPYELEGVQ